MKKLTLIFIVLICFYVTVESATQQIDNDKYIKYFNELIKENFQKVDNTNGQKENIEPPLLIYYILPEFPSEAKKNGLAGKVVIQLEIDESGSVSKLKVLTSSKKIFETPTIDALMQWKFKPAKRNGQPIKIFFNIPIVFQQQL